MHDLEEQRGIAADLQQSPPNIHCCAHGKLSSEENVVRIEDSKHRSVIRTTNARSNGLEDIGCGTDIRALLLIGWGEIEAETQKVDDLNSDVIPIRRRHAML